MNSNEILLGILKEKGLTLSLAESCTGGMVGARITDLPGASEVYLGSAGTYSNDSKERILDVKHSTLLEYGAVSEETAEEMALGSKYIYGSKIAASVTGIAGPGGGTDLKPVGTVWMAVTDGVMIKTCENHFTGDRQSIREQSVEGLIRLIIEFVGD